jgi:hypothetical protein
VDLGREEGCLALREVFLAQSDQPEGLVHGPVEEHMVIGHVHMAVVVDPSGLDPHRRRDEGGEEEDWSPLAHDRRLPAIATAEYPKRARGKR